MVYATVNGRMPSSPDFSPALLNAGSAVNVTGPQGRVALNYQSGTYENTGFPVVVPANGGTFSFDNGGGGTQVGPFSATLAIPPPFTWTNQGAVSGVDRNAGLTIEWSGGDSSGYVQISGSASAVNGAGTLFNCAAPIGAGRFTVPPTVLLSLPASAGGALSVSNFMRPQSFSASGLDAGLLSGFYTTTIVLPYR
jgi:hypothetical protein